MATGAKRKLQLTEWSRVGYRLDAHRTCRGGEPGTAFRRVRGALPRLDIDNATGAGRGLSATLSGYANLAARASIAGKRPLHSHRPAMWHANTVPGRHTSTSDLALSHILARHWTRHFIHYYLQLTER